MPAVSFACRLSFPACCLPPCILSSLPACCNLYDVSFTASLAAWSQAPSLTHQHRPGRSSHLSQNTHGTICPVQCWRPFCRSSSSRPRRCTMCTPLGKIQEVCFSVDLQTEGFVFVSKIDFEREFPHIYYHLWTTKH